MSKMVGTAKTATRSTGSSAKVRDLAVQKYVAPNVRKHVREFSIPVRGLMLELRDSGFPVENTPQICTAIRSRKFLRENNLVIDHIDGPPSGQSTTVVVHYRFKELQTELPGQDGVQEWAKRIIRESEGLLQPAVTHFGSAEALLQWVRSEGEQ